MGGGGLSQMFHRGGLSECSFEEEGAQRMFQRSSIGNRGGKFVNNNLAQV